MGTYEEELVTKNINLCYSLALKYYRMFRWFYRT